MKRFLFYAFAMLAIVACTESETDGNGSDNGGGNNPSAPSITLNQSIVTFDDAAGEEQVSFSATADWIAELVNDRADSWLSISPKSGAAGNASIAIKATENDTPDDRSATIRLKAGSAMKTISVTQKQKDALTVTSSKFEVEAKGGEVQIEVKANIDFEYVIDESAKEWVAYEGTRAMKTSTLTFKVAENDDTERREGTITIKSGDFNEVVTIYQAGCEPSIVISKSEYVVSSNSETIAVEVKSNVDVAVEMPSDVDWISENTTRAASTNTYRFDIAANEGYDQRTAEIKFTNKENNLSEVVTIVQSQRDAIVLAKSEYEFGVNGGNLDFEIQTNVDITVKISDNAKNWIQQVESRGLEAKKLFFNVYSYSGQEDREGTITLSGGNATQTITVKQSGLKEILEKEREALIALYKATDGDNWTNNTNWCSDKPVSEWYGVFCTDHDGTVWNISLRHNNLRGNIPECIGDFASLAVLRLNGNQLSGPIPECIGKLSQLSELYLMGNQLSGSIPESIGNLLSLYYLALSNNQLSGPIPESIGNLEHLGYLEITNNKMSGSLPNQMFAKLPNLKRLLLSNNSFSGKLPDVHANIISCQLDNNLFTGEIPESHSKVFQKNPKFDYQIDGNYLTGEVPIEMINNDYWHLHWRYILPQKLGYGFKPVDIVAPQNVVKCYDDSLLDLGEEYRKNKYTIIFSWQPGCVFSKPYMTPIYKLYQKYKEKGLGLVCTTPNKYSLSKMEELTSIYEDVKVFWEVMANQGNADDSWDNNPYADIDGRVYLFRTLGTPYFHVIDNSANIVFYGSGDFDSECIPQYHENRDEIYDFVANLFGDDKYEEDISYTSTDFSKDGEVKQLQKATKGEGIDIVLMGDAYSDRLIADGTYDKVMNTAMEKFFMEEPYKSFRDHFNVYSVTAVSDNEVYTDDSSTAFAGYFGEGTLVGGNDQRVFSYAQKAIGADRMDEALIVVMMNSGAYAGTCWMYHSSADTGDCGNGVSISYFPVGSDDTALAQVLHHEAGGHGFSKLADEYAYENMGAMPDAEISSRKSYEPYGWWKNADFTSDPTKVKWNTFLSDARYANDGLGVFEGAFTYWTRAYRPTENSIMRHNTGGFNAPSREAIYYRIHKLAYGAEWEYDYEKFVEWDARNRKTAAATRGVPYRLDVPIDFKPLHAPVVVNTSWREAKNTAPAKRAIRQSVGNSVSGSYRASSGARPQVSVSPVTHDRTITMSDGITRSWSTNTTKQGR
ncbi:MAG: hypothetical protein E7127_05030 [Rikenellaceae bacterium]|nr:hypothetical protein [Rikenellaceae bacterium]